MSTPETEKPPFDIPGLLSEAGPAEKVSLVLAASAVGLVTLDALLFVVTAGNIEPSMPFTSAVLDLVS